MSCNVRQCGGAKGTLELAAAHLQPLKRENRAADRHVECIDRALPGFVGRSGCVEHLVRISRCQEMRVSRRVPSCNRD